MVDRISTAGQHNRLVDFALGRQLSLAKAQEQASTGETSQTYQGISRDVVKLNTVKSLTQSRTQLIRNMEEAQVHTDRQGVVMSQIRQTMDSVRTAMNNILGSSDAGDFISVVTSAFETVKTLVNTTVNSRFIFNGTETEDPVVPQSFSTTSSFTPTPTTTTGMDITAGALTGNTATITLSTALPDGFFVGDGFTATSTDTTGPTVTTILPPGTKITSINAARTSITVEVLADQVANYTAGTFTHNAVTSSNAHVLTSSADNILKTNISQSPQDRSVITDDNVFVDFAISGKDMAQPFMAILGEVIQFNAGRHPVHGGTQFLNGPNAITPEQREFIEGLLDDMKTNLNNMTNLEAENGLVQKRFEDAILRHEDELVFLANFEAEIEDVDVVEASVNLNLSETALNISMQTLARTNSISLINFI